VLRDGAGPPVLTHKRHRRDWNSAAQQSPAAPRCVIFRSEARELPTVKRREFIILIGGAAAAWPLAVRAQQGERMRRIGVISPANDQPTQVRYAAFIQGLQQLGWTEGRNMRIDAR
jgi:hypothetical protein